MLPQRAAWAFAGNDLAILFPACGGVPILFGFGALFRRAKERDRRALRIFLCVLFAYFAWQASFLLRDPGATLSERSARAGPVLQSQKWSCAPTAAAVLLGTLGIDASEAEMAARLMRTRPTFGTETLLVERGMERKLAGTAWRAVLRPFTYDDLVQSGRPGLAAIRLEILLDHMIAFTRASADEIEVIDPLAGVKTVSRAKFEAEWTGQAILVEPRTE
jgi:hypothetical protein